jgi:hypothetical protein
MIFRDVTQRRNISPFNNITYTENGGKNFHLDSGIYQQDIWFHKMIILIPHEGILLPPYTSYFFNFSVEKEFKITEENSIFWSFILDSNEV